MERAVDRCGMGRILSLETLAMPIFLAGSVISLAGCTGSASDVPTDPQQAPEAGVLDLHVNVEYEARDSAHQQLLVGCAEVRAACDVLLGENRDSLDSTAVTALLERTSTDLLVLRASGTFSDMSVVDASYRSMQDVVDIVRSQERFYPIKKPTVGKYLTDEENYHRIQELRSNMDLMISVSSSQLHRVRRRGKKALSWSFSTYQQLI